MKSATPIETNELCAHNCGNTAQYITKEGKMICLPFSNSCPKIKEKNSKGGKKSYATGKRIPSSHMYQNLSQDQKDRMNWAKGLTKETHPSIMKNSLALKGKPRKGHPHTEETKHRLSIIRTEYLQNPENRKKMNPPRSWLEVNFEQWLIYNNITNYQMEIPFRNPNTKNFWYVDFLFEDKKLIIELDGNQHEKTVECDAIRDKHLTSLGYIVKRIKHDIFKKLFFSGKGFWDYLT